MKGPKTKKPAAPFAPLERDVEPNLRKLGFVRARRSDPPLISESAMKKMIVLNGARGEDADARGGSIPSSSSRATPRDDATLPNGVAVKDALYPAANIKMEWPAARKIGAGLANLGNTCFMNAVMQCLTHTPPLAQFCLAGEHRKYKPKPRRDADGDGDGGGGSGGSGGSFSALYEMGEHVSRALGREGRRHTIAPATFVKNLRALSKTFRKGRQEDAHEFARCLLDAMHKRCVDAARPKPKEGSARSETSFVWQVFGGRLRSRVACKTCGKMSDTFDSFMDLSLDVARSRSVQSALKSYTAVEVLDGANKYKCEMGPGKPHMTRATKQFTIDAAPKVLTIQLKRFEYVPFGRGKLNQFVEYPTRLDVSEAMSDASPRARGRERYSLFGVLVHSGGSMHSGHYYCYVKGSTGHWYEMDDEGVSPVSEKTALSQRAYLLFYARAPPAAASAPGASSPIAGQIAPKRELNEKERKAAKASERKRKEDAAAAAAAAAARGAAADDDDDDDDDDEPFAASAAERVKKKRRVVPTSLPEPTPKPSTPPWARPRDRPGGGSPSSPEDARAAAAAALKSPKRYHRSRSPFLSARESVALSLKRNRRLHRMKRNGSLSGSPPPRVRPARTRSARRRDALGSPRSPTSPRSPEVAPAPAAARKATAVETIEKKRSKTAAGVTSSAAAAAAADGGASKSVKQWLNRAARASNVVGRGGDAGAWDAEGGGSPDENERPKPPGERGGGGGRARGGDDFDVDVDFDDARKTKQKPGRGIFKRARAYDDLDEEYDRGKTSKHQRRKAEGRIGGKTGRVGGGGSSRSANPFATAARLKRER